LASLERVGSAQRRRDGAAGAAGAARSLDQWCTPERCTF